MSLSSSRIAAALVAGALALGSAPAFAQQMQPAAPAGQPGQPPGPGKVDLTPSQDNWTKVCGHDQAANKDICYTTRDFGAQKDQ
ncbi:MAG: invasion associated locus B family protein, partial [Rhodoblastus sp.]